MHMVNNLAKAGRKVYIYDVVPAAVARFDGVTNVEAVSKASELAAKVKTVILMLPKGLGHTDEVDGAHELVDHLYRLARAAVIPPLTMAEVQLYAWISRA